MGTLLYLAAGWRSRWALPVCGTAPRPASHPATPPMGSNSAAAVLAGYCSALTPAAHITLAHLAVSSSGLRIRPEMARHLLLHPAFLAQRGRHNGGRNGRRSALYRMRYFSSAARSISTPRPGPSGIITQPPCCRMVLVIDDGATEATTGRTRMPVPRGSAQGRQAQLSPRGQRASRQIWRRLEPMDRSGWCAVPVHPDALTAAPARRGTSG